MKAIDRVNEKETYLNLEKYRISKRVLWNNKRHYSYLTQFKF